MVYASQSTKFAFIYTITFFVIFLAIFFGNGGTVFGCACSCAKWDCQTTCQQVSPWGCTQKCSCTDPQCQTTCTCGPGTYVCNEGCCPIGTPPIGGGGGPSCTETATTGMIATKTSAKSAILDWTPGTGGVHQDLWVSTNPNPQTGCAGSAGGTAVCPVRLDEATTPLSKSSSSYTITNKLAANTVYYWRIMNVQTSSCFVSTTKTIPSATLTLTPVTATTYPGSAVTLTAAVTNLKGGTVSKVTYTTSDPAVATINKAADTAKPYNVIATGVATGAATITAHAWMNGSSVAFDSSKITVINPTCTVNLTPVGATIPIFTTSDFTASVTPVGGTVSNVTFSSSDSTVATVSPTTGSYTTTASALTVGNAIVTTNVYMAGVLRCSDTSAITSVPAPAWWQVKDSDVSSRDKLTSYVPQGNTFGIDGNGGFPGIPAYSTSTNLSSVGTISRTGWVANSAIANAKIYDYKYFANLIPTGTTINTLATSVFDQTEVDKGLIDVNTGYYWFQFDGSSSGLPLDINSDISIGSKKVILLVNSANLNIGAQINGITKGQGFFMVVVSGNIVVNPSVGGGTTVAPNLEGLYVADNTFYSGSGATPLYVRGSVVGYNLINLQRDLGNANNLINASEVFEYAPDQIVLFPKVLGTRKINWKEVAP